MGAQTSPGSNEKKVQSHDLIKDVNPKNIGAELLDEEFEVPLAPLHVAAAMGFLRVCTFLIEHCHQNPAEVNPTNGSTPLIYACRSSHVEVVRLLLEHKSVRETVNYQHY